MATESPTGYLVVIGASAGGISALMLLAQTLPAGFPAPICVVQHVGANHSILPELLSGKGPHPAVHERDGQLLTPGVIHVAPPDHQMLVDGRYLRLTCGPRENPAFSARSLERAQADEGEQTLRSGVRALRERELLLRRMAAVAEATGDGAQADAARRQADRLHAQVRDLRNLAASVQGEQPWPVYHGGRSSPPE